MLQFEGNRLADSLSLRRKILSPTSCFLGLPCERERGQPPTGLVHAAWECDEATPHADHADEKK